MNKLISHPSRLPAGFGETESQYEENKQVKSRNLLRTRPVVVQTEGYRALASNMRQYVLEPPATDIHPWDSEETKRVKTFCNITRPAQGVICATSRTSSVCSSDRGGPLLHEHTDHKLCVSLTLSSLVSWFSESSRGHCWTNGFVEQTLFSFSYQIAIASLPIAQESGSFNVTCVRGVKVAYVRIRKHLEFIRERAGRIC